MFLMAILLIVLSLSDAIQLQKIALILRVVPVSEDKTRALFFILAMFFSYLILGILVYVVMNVYHEQILKQLLRYYQYYVGIVGIIGGVSLSIYSLFLLFGAIRRSIKKESQRELPEITKVLRGINTTSLIRTAISATVMSFPMALPYFFFIGININQKSLGREIILYLFAYCLIYIAPMLFVYAHAIVVPQAAYLIFEKKTKKRIQRINEYMRPLVYLLIAIVILREAIS